jgi:hypothetical protein
MSSFKRASKTSTGAPDRKDDFEDANFFDDGFSSVKMINE